MSWSNGIEAIEVSENGRLLVYKPGYSPDFVRDTLAREQLNGLRVFAQLAEDVPRDLEFLRSFSFLTHLDITAIPAQDFDYGFLAALGALRHFALNVPLSATAKPQPLDLRQVPSLTSLTLTWRTGITGFDALTELEELCLVEFRGEDLTKFVGARRLKKLMLKTTSIRSVSGIEAHQSLEVLLLGACARLRDLDALSALAQLRELTLSGCPKLTHLDPLSALQQLTQLTLEDCRRLETIRPLAALKLERLTLGGRTDIRDGDITPAGCARDLFYAHRKHYNVRLPTPLQDAIAEENRRTMSSWR